MHHLRMNSILNRQAVYLFFVHLFMVLFACFVLFSFITLPLIHCITLNKWFDVCFFFFNIPCLKQTKYHLKSVA